MDSTSSTHSSAETRAATWLRIRAPKPTPSIEYSVTADQGAEQDLRDVRCDGDTSTSFQAIIG